MTQPQDQSWMEDEFAGAELGDARRVRRLVEVATAMSRCPGASLPDMLGGEAELEGAYRFFSNSTVEHDAVLSPHVSRTGVRCTDRGEALVLHDTTDIRFDCYGDVRRKGVTRVSKNKQGFFVHASLAVAADGSRFPLGMLSARSYVHESDIEDDETRRWWTERDGLMDNEQERWLQSVIAAEAAAPDASLIHVCDREGDAYELLAALVEFDSRFVIRLEHNRRVRDSDGTVTYIDDALESVEERPSLTRQIWIQPRYGGNRYVSKDTNHQHKGRSATVAFRSARLEVLRAQGRPELGYLADSIELSVVEVVEQNPPQGAEPVRWKLATTEPVESSEDLLRVVDMYRTRWVVEDFFKALKTGCAYEKRQLESAHALLNMLAVTIPIAVHMLMLRDLAHSDTEFAANQLFSPLEVMVMRQLTDEEVVPTVPTTKHAIHAIAKLGGHIPANGPPGWLVLYRGYVELISAKRGFAAALKMLGVPLPEM